MKTALIYINRTTHNGQVVWMAHTNHIQGVEAKDATLDGLMDTLRWLIPEMAHNHHPGEAFHILYDIQGDEKS